MPFQNLTGDSSFDHLEISFQDLLINKLASSRELSIRQHETMFDILKTTGYLEIAGVSPAQAREIGEILNCRTVIHGSIHKAGNLLRITTNLLDSRSDEVFNTYEITGDLDKDFFLMADSLSDMIKNFLEIKLIAHDLEAEAKEIEYTSSSEAYRFFVEGTQLFFELDFPASIQSFHRAIEIDSTFTLAVHFLAVAYLNNDMPEQGKYWLMKADRDRENVPRKNQLYIDRFKAEIEKDQQAVIEYLRQITEIDPYYRIAWFDLGMNYNILEQYDRSIDALKTAMKINERQGHNWQWAPFYVTLGEAYHHLDLHQIENEVYNTGLSVLHDEPMIIYRQAICALSQDNQSDASFFISKYTSLLEEEGALEEFRILSKLGEMHYLAGKYEEAESYYRQALEADPQNLNLTNQLAWFLIHTERGIEEGTELNSRTLQSDPDDYNYLETRGMALYRSRDTEEALEILQKAWELRPDYKHSHKEYIQLAEASVAGQI